MWKSEPKRENKLKRENMSRNVKRRAETWKCEPMHENARWNIKCEMKYENVRRNIKMRAVTWKHESKHENASQNMKTRDETWNVKKRAETWKLEPKHENMSRNMKLRAETWKRDFKSKPLSGKKARKAMPFYMAFYCSGEKIEFPFFLAFRRSGIFGA